MITVRKILKSKRTEKVAGCVLQCRLKDGTYFTSRLIPDTEEEIAKMKDYILKNYDLYDNSTTRNDSGTD